VISRLTLRRLVTVGVAATAGTAAALVLASPASAHHPTVSGKAVCDSATGDWVVTWTVGNTEDDLTGEVISVTLTPASTTVSKIAVGATIPKDGDGTLDGVQRVSTSETSASLTVKARWIRDNRIIEDSRTGKAEFEGTCAAKPTAEFTTDCVGVVTVKLMNTAGTAEAHFTVTGKNGFAEKKTVAAGTEDKVTVPAANSAEVTVTEGPDNTMIATGKRAVPGTCGNLPVTGVKVGAAAAGALGLVGIGTFLFLAARRRRIRFTA